MREEQRVRRALVVCRENERRKLDDGIEIVPWPELCAELWAGDLIH